MDSGDVFVQIGNAGSVIDILQRESRKRECSELSFDEIKKKGGIISLYVYSCVYSVVHLELKSVVIFQATVMR